MLVDFDTIASKLEACDAAYIFFRRESVHTVGTFQAGEWLFISYIPSGSSVRLRNDLMHLI